MAHREIEQRPGIPLPDMTRTGEPDLLRELYDRYARDLYRIGYRLTGSRADAEDVVQEVFVGLPEALRAYEEHGKLDAWLRKVATRVALSKLRRRSRRHEVPLDGIPEPGAMGSSGTLVDAIDLQSALRALPETLRSVLVLKELEGYSHEEIGQMLGIQPGASKVRLHRAREALRLLLRRAT